MAAGGGGGKAWIFVLAGGTAAVLVVMGLEWGHVELGWIGPGILGAGGLAIVFGACESMIKAVEGIAQRANMNEFVAGTMAGLASNVPEVVMLAFVLAAAPRVGFIVTALTLHIGAALFGGYSLLLPRDAHGHAELPKPLVKLSTDLYACAGAAFFTTGAIMVVMNVFDVGDFRGEALGAPDLYVLGGALLVVQVVAVWRLVTRFRGSDEGSTSAPASKTESKEVPSVATIAFFGLLGVGASVLGGHAVGDFAESLVHTLTEAGYPQMIGALILSVFAVTGVVVMMGSAHVKGMYDIALANASGQISQVPFLVMPIALILLAVFAQTGVIERTPHGGVLPIDLETTSVLLLGFPSMVILWKAVQDDGKVNWLETVTMLAIFGLTIYFLAAHG